MSNVLTLLCSCTHGQSRQPEPLLHLARHSSLHNTVLYSLDYTGCMDGHSLHRSIANAAEDLCGGQKPLTFSALRRKRSERLLHLTWDGISNCCMRHPHHLGRKTHSTNRDCLCYVQADPYVSMRLDMELAVYLIVQLHISLIP